MPEALDANEKPVLTLKEQKDLDRRHQQDQREIKQLKQELRRMEKALAEAAALLLAAKKIQAFWVRTRTNDLARRPPEGFADHG